MFAESLKKMLTNEKFRICMLIIISTLVTTSQYKVETQIYYQSLAGINALNKDKSLRFTQVKH